MKLYLASFMEPPNFGPGRIFSIANGLKPKNINVEGFISFLAPDINLVSIYNDARNNNEPTASECFINGYQLQLDNFVLELEKDAKDAGKSIQEILPFKDGDTLASWERERFTNYRRILAPILEKMGYEIILH